MTHREEALKLATMKIAEATHNDFRNDSVSIACGNWINPHVIAEALTRVEKEARSKMCVHKECDEIGGDCEVCAEIVKVGGEQYKRGWNQAIEKSVEVVHELEKQVFKRNVSLFEIATAIKQLTR